MGKFFSFIWSHKLKYLFALLSFLVFCVVLFPFNDVGDLVTGQVYKATGKQVYLQMQRLNLGIFPLSVGVENASVETPQLSPISAQSFEVQPSFDALFSQEPIGTAIAKGLFRGDVDVNVKRGKTTELGAPTYILSLNAKSLSLAEIHKVVQLPVMMKGKLNVATIGTADLTFQQQPDFDVEVKVENLEIPSGMVETQMGPVNVPDLRLSSLDLKGRLSAGRFTIERGQIGKDGDEIFGTVKGNISLIMQNRGGGPMGVQPIPGAYSFDVDLQVKKNLAEKATLFLALIDQQKVPTADGFRYQFRATGSGPMGPPSISALR